MDFEAIPEFASNDPLLNDELRRFLKPFFEQFLICGGLYFIFLS